MLLQGTLPHGIYPLALGKLHLNARKHLHPRRQGTARTAAAKSRGLNKAAVIGKEGHHLIRFAPVFGTEHNSGSLITGHYFFSSSFGVSLMRLGITAPAVSMYCRADSLLISK